MLSSDQKGAIAELAIAKAAIAQGINVFRPVHEGVRYDLIFDLGDRLDRVQCKWASVRGETVVVYAYSSRRAADGLRKRPYVTGEIDAIAAYCHRFDRCFYLPVARLQSRLQIALRVGPSRNNQAARVNWADDFGLERLQFTSLGP